MSAQKFEPLGERFTAQACDWIVPSWPVAAQVQSFVTTRNGAAGDARAFLPSPPAWLDQVHGTTVAIIAGESHTGARVADAAVTRERDAVLAVRVADCLPVLLAARDGHVVGIAHAGWRGLAHGVIENTVAAMETSPSNVVAWFGPAIGPDAFEVGADVFRAFTDFDAGAAASFLATGHPGRWRADLYALATRRLERAGVQAVFGGGFCTYSDPERFYSYRRARETGRMAAFLWIGS
jgi:YfiH family protein